MFNTGRNCLFTDNYARVLSDMVRMIAVLDAHISKYLAEEQ